ncbi:Protein of unknown function [Gryllus bimaculatus]|nr:Protein of unknown function [Gryllus bimaculatus]
MSWEVVVEESRLLSVAGNKRRPIEKVKQKLRMKEELKQEEETKQQKRLKMEEENRKDMQKQKEKKNRQLVLNPGYTVDDPLFGPSEVTPTAAMGVIDPCTQAAFQTEMTLCAVEHAVTTSAAAAYASFVKGSWAVHYADTSCAADAYASLVNDLLNPCEVSLNVLMDVFYVGCGFATPPELRLTATAPAPLPPSRRHRTSPPPPPPRPPLHHSSPSAYPATAPAPTSAAALATPPPPTPPTRAPPPPPPPSPGLDPGAAGALAVLRPESQIKRAVTLPLRSKLGERMKRAKNEMRKEYRTRHVACSKGSLEELLDLPSYEDKTRSGNLTFNTQIVENEEGEQQKDGEEKGGKDVKTDLIKESHRCVLEQSNFLLPTERCSLLAMGVEKVSSRPLVGGVEGLKRLPLRNSPNWGKHEPVLMNEEHYVIRIHGMFDFLGPRAFSTKMFSFLEPVAGGSLLL